MIAGMARFPIAPPGFPRCTRFCSAPPAVELAPANATAGQSRSLGLRVRYRMDATRLYIFIFGALTIIGGIIGYVKAGSLPSIIAGAITGVLLLIAASLLSSHR